MPTLRQWGIYPDDATFRRHRGMDLRGLPKDRQKRGLGAMTDNRTNEPNKYAGYLARQEHQRDRWRGIGVKCLCGKVFDLDADHALHQVEEILRAALVAAAGAAPQAESDPYRIVRVLHEHQRDTSVTSRVKCVCGVTCGDRASHRLHQAELIAHLAPAPVQPSSIVDEAALIREAKAEAWDEGYDEWSQAPAGDQPPRENPYREGSET